MTDDLISRQAAIYAIEKRMDDITCEEFAEGMSEAITEISLLSSVQPERKKGKWIPHYDDEGEHYGDKCSECGEWYVMPYGKTHFCPNCGARMEGEE